MKRTAIRFLGVAAVAGVIAGMGASSPGQDEGQVNTGMAAGKTATDAKAQPDGKEAKQVIVTVIPPGYRDWKFISAAHERVH